MLLKDYVEGLVKLLNDNPEYGELEVWTYSDDEGNSIRPCDGGVLEAYVSKEGNWETDDYVTGDYLHEYLDDLDMEMIDFLEENKLIILI